MFTFWKTENNEVTSANSSAFDDKPLVRSFTYIRKRTGPNTEPWGTPALTSAQGSSFPSSTTFYFLFLKNAIPL